MNSFDFESTIKGRPWRAKLLLKGDAYGLDDCLAADRPLVEFWDRKIANKPGRNGHVWPDDGQFVSRYCLSTLLDRYPHGIDLLSYVEAWTISAEDFAKVRAWLAKAIDEELKR